MITTPSTIIVNRKPTTHQDKVVDLKKKVKVLTEKLLESFDELNIFYDINRSLNNIYNITGICNTTLAYIVKIIRVEKASISIVDEDRKHLTITSCLGFSENIVGHKINIQNTLYEEVIKRRKPLMEKDVDQRLIDTKKRSRYKTKSFILHPLYTHPLTISGDVIGVISLADKPNRQPFNSRDLKFLSAISTQAAMVIQNALLVANLKESFLVTVRSLSAAIDAKDHYTHGHSERVNHYALQIGRIMGISQSELDQLELACLLHDVGKIGIPENILNKAEKLTPEEMSIIRKHPLKGLEILKNAKLTKATLAAVRHHHERYDGGGYPDGLKAEEIPLLARIITVVDTFDAMISDRPYRPRCTKMTAIAKIYKDSGSQHDPRVVQALLKINQSMRSIDHFKSPLNPLPGLRTKAIHKGSEQGAEPI